MMEHIMNNHSDDQIDDPACSAMVRQLNDAFRQTLTGGTVLMTAGVVALGADRQAQVLAAVRAFDAFTPDNDPWDEHDFGAIDAAGERIFFKLDYYDLTRAYHSSDPADPAVTERVLTIMLASEY
jgi:hypothetical protein